MSNRRRLRIRMMIKAVVRQSYPMAQDAGGLKYRRAEQAPAAAVHPCTRGTRTSMCIVGVDPTGACGVVGGYTAMPRGSTAARLEPTYDAKQNFANLSRFPRSEEHTSELQSLMRISYAVFCLKKQKNNIKLTVDL